MLPFLDKNHAVSRFLKFLTFPAARRKAGLSMLNYEMCRSIFCKNHARERAALVEFTKIFKNETTL